MMTGREFVENFGVRLEKERTDLCYSQTEMAQALNMSLSSYKRIINGESNKIDIYTVYLLQQLTNKVCDELCGLDSPALDLYNLLLKLSEPQIRFITDLVLFEIEFAEGLEPKESVEDYVTMIIPSGNMQDGMIYDSFSIDKINIAPYRRRYDNQIDFAFKITSDHMQPVYHRNDILLIRRGPVRDGDTGIFVNKETGLAYIRKYVQSSPDRIEPITNYGQTFFIGKNSHWIKLGYVITKTRT